jgi:hypothetical protein
LYFPGKQYQKVSGICKFDGLSSTLYYRKPIMSLQRFDLMRQRGLGKVYALGGT